MTDTLLLIKPNKSLENELLIYQNEFATCTEDMHGTSSLNNFNNIPDWINHLFLYENRDTMPNKSFVPGHQYILVRQTDNKVIGMLHLRIELNDTLAKVGGHIGYSIAPSERHKGYGTIILKYGLKQAKEFQLNKILITCDDDNIGSAKVIENNNGTLENTFFDEFSKKDIRRYWIDL